MKQLPATVDQLIDSLEKMYPERCARLGQTQDEIFYEAGQRSVVQKLIKLKGTFDPYGNKSTIKRSS